MTFHNRREAMRAVLAGRVCVRPAIVSDPLSARMAEELGFEAGMIPGSDVALAVLGAPDIALVTMSEFVDQVHRMTRASALPLVADGDHGYGNALNVRRFIGELETVGLSAVTIEDTELPAAFAAGRGRLIPLPEAAGKIRAAVAGRQDAGFAIIGRTSLALAEGGLAETAARIRAYETAGADAIFVQGLQTRAELDVLAGAISLPFVLPKPTAALDDEAYLASRQVRLCFPSGPKAITAALDAAHGALVAQRRGAARLALTHADLLRRLTRADDYDAARKAFLAD